MSFVGYLFLWAVLAGIGVFMKKTPIKSIFVGFVLASAFMIITAPSKKAENIPAPEKQIAQKQAPTPRPPRNTESWRTSDNTTGASTMVRDLVRSQLVAPSTAKFPGMFTVAQQTHKIGDRKYRIRSYVDAQNRFGAMIRINYIMEFEQTGPELHSGHWKITHFKALE